jgi:hypothetical protein
VLTLSNAFVVCSPVIIGNSVNKIKGQMKTPGIVFPGVYFIVVTEKELG